MKKAAVLLVCLAACQAEPPPKPAPTKPAVPPPVACYEKANPLSLSVDGRIALCSDAKDPDGRVDCYKAARKKGLTLDGAVALCSSATSLFALAERKRAATRDKQAVSRHGLVTLKLGQLEKELKALKAASVKP